MRIQKLLLLSAILIVALSCTESNEKIKEDVILTSIQPIKSLIDSLTGNSIKSIAVIKPGWNPSTYEPTPDQLKMISKSATYVSVGNDFIFDKIWLEKFQSLNKELQVFDLSNDIKIENHDPHIWNSPILLKEIVVNLAKKLIKLYPEKHFTITQNMAVLIERLDSIEIKFQDLFTAKTEKSFLVFHPSWFYLAKDFGLNQIAIEDHGAEPNPADLSKIISFAKSNGLKAIFVSPQHSKISAQAIADEIGVEVIELNPLPDNILANFEDIISKFEKYL
ncbi:MAG: zinc ABC transporter substrate-binding protein [Melioribacteraceae bacterium]|nr:zinc ABC transporter substrate-binding protein [Melioribacteraceae bacterium]